MQKLTSIHFSVAAKQQINTLSHYNISKDKIFVSQLGWMDKPGYFYGKYFLVNNKAGSVFTKAETSGKFHKGSNI